MSQFLNLLVMLLVLSIVGLTSGFASLSIWLMKLTALARMQLMQAENSLDRCLKELAASKKYLGTVWILGMLYLLGPLLPMSVLTAVSLLASMKLTVFGEPILNLPDSWILPINLASGLLFLLALDYSLILTVLSSVTSSEWTPRKLASHSADILCKYFGRISVLNLVLLLLDFVISAPFLLLAPLPQFAFLANNLQIALACQLWFALASLICWPLSLLIFVEFLKTDLAVSTGREYAIA